MIKKLFILLYTTAIFNTCNAKNGVYIGGGFGSGMQDISVDNQKAYSNTPSIRLYTGYQFISWLGAEIGYNYITQGGNTFNYGHPSTTVYDLSITPGIPLPILPISLFGRVGINAVSSNMDSSWYNQIFSNSNANFEWGIGLKLDIPSTDFFARMEYIGFNPTINNNNSAITVNPSIGIISIGYVF
jgi:hypothetical protein